MKEEDMSKQGIKFFIILFIFISCGEKNIVIESRNDIYLNKKFNEYSLVYTSLLDTLNAWKLDSMAISKGYFFSDCWKLDSMIVFNKDSSRLYTNILHRSCKHKGGIFDYLQAIGGAKIDSQWYFFFGMQPVIDRASYQDSIHAPLSFDELSYLAREHLLGAYTIQEDGTITTNDSFFDFMYNRGGWGLPDSSSLEQLDSLIIAKTTEVRKMKIDPKEIEDIKRSMARSVRPPEPKKDVSLWQRIFGKEEKLFETKEWKAYLEKKYGKVSEE